MSESATLEMNAESDLTVELYNHPEWRTALLKDYALNREERFAVVGNAFRARAWVGAAVARAIKYGGGAAIAGKPGWFQVGWGYWGGALVPDQSRAVKHADGNGGELTLMPLAKAERGMGGSLALGFLIGDPSKGGITGAVIRRPRTAELVFATGTGMLFADSNTAEGKNLEALRLAVKPSLRLPPMRWAAKRDRGQSASEAYKTYGGDPAVESAMQILLANEGARLFAID